MKKPEYIKQTEEDMDFQAEYMVKELEEYAEKNNIECDFVFETFLKAFRKEIKAESEE
jgi:hypothetical protein